MSNPAAGPPVGGTTSDLAALKRWFWLPLATLAVAIAAALLVGAVSSTSTDARFRGTVVVDALAPLFGPTILPGPVQYAAVATSDAVIVEVVRETNRTPEELRPRLIAEPRFNRPDIEFRVTGPDALAVARVWRDAIDDAVVQQTTAVALALADPYRRQLAEAEKRLLAEAAAAQAAPADPVAAQRLNAAEENYATASKLAQSYDVVASTMRVRMFPSVAPRLESPGVGSMRGRLAAAVAIGLLAGVIGVVALEALSRRRAPAPVDVDDAPAELRRVRSTR